MTSERCLVCDRVDCPAAPFQGMDCDEFDEVAGLPGDPEYAAYLAKEADCRAHRVDWRSRALAAESSLRARPAVDGDEALRSALAALVGAAWQVVRGCEHLPGERKFVAAIEQAEADLAATARPASVAAPGVVAPFGVPVRPNAGGRDGVAALLDEPGQHLAALGGSGPEGVAQGSLLGLVDKQGAVEADVLDRVGESAHASPIAATGATRKAESTARPAPSEAPRPLTVGIDQITRDVVKQYACNRHAFEWMNEIRERMGLPLLTEADYEAEREAFGERRLVPEAMADVEPEWCHDPDCFDRTCPGSGPGGRVNGRRVLDPDTVPDDEPRAVARAAKRSGT